MPKLDNRSRLEQQQVNSCAYQDYSQDPILWPKHIIIFFQVDEHKIWPVPKGQELDYHWETNPKEVLFAPVGPMVVNDDLDGKISEYSNIQALIQGFDEVKTFIRGTVNAGDIKVT